MRFLAAMIFTVFVLSHAAPAVEPIVDMLFSGANGLAFLAACVIGLIVGSAPAYALGWRARARKSAEDGHAKVEQQYERDRKLA